MAISTNIKPIEGKAFFVQSDAFVWGYIFLDEENKTFMAQTSEGTFGYNWNRVGPCFKQFLNGVSYDYLMSKFRPETSGKVFNLEATIKANKKQILENLENGEIDNEIAYEAIEYLSELHAYTHDGFFHICSQSEEVQKAISPSGDLWEDLIIMYQDDNSCRIFWNKIYIPFLKHIITQEPSTFTIS